MKQDKWKNNYKIKSMNQDKLIEDNYLNSTKKLQNKSPWIKTNWLKITI